MFYQDVSNSAPTRSCRLMQDLQLDECRAGNIKCSTTEDRQERRSDGATTDAGGAKNTRRSCFSRHGRRLGYIVDAADKCPQIKGRSSKESNARANCHFKYIFIYSRLLSSKCLVMLCALLINLTTNDLEHSCQRHLDRLVHKS